MIYTFIRRKYKPIPQDAVNFLSEPPNKKVIIFYGRTGSSKSYTMKELLPLFYTPEESVNIIEIHLEKVKVLLNEKVISSMDELIKIVDKLRKTKKTKGNDNSSRSVLILQLTDTILVDMMGSEKPEDREGIRANQTILELSRTIIGLSQGRKETFRGCTLTMILKPYFSTHTIVFIGCVDESDTKETSRTESFIKLLQGVTLEKTETLIHFGEEEALENILKELENIEEILSGNISQE